MSKHCKDLTGQQFGSLTALRLAYVGSNYLAYWEYQCACGKLHTARANTVSYITKKSTNPLLPSCGCMELKLKTKHGYRCKETTHPLYRVHKGIMDRCYNSKLPNYQWYGAAGVTICDEWKGNPKAFIEWGLANGYKPGLHIDKDILCDANGIHPHIYSPETCQFIPAKTNVGYATDRSNYGSHPNVKLSSKQVGEIIHKYTVDGIKGPTLAKQYNVGTSAIYRILRLGK